MKFLKIVTTCLEFLKTNFNVIIYLYYFTLKFLQQSISLVLKTFHDSFKALLHKTEAEPCKPLKFTMSLLLISNDIYAYHHRTRITLVHKNFGVKKNVNLQDFLPRNSQNRNMNSNLQSTCSKFKLIDLQIQTNLVNFEVFWGVPHLLLHWTGLSCSRISPPLDFWFPSCFHYKNHQ